MESVILCAGEGVRAAEYTANENKCLTLIDFNRYERILDYSLQTAFDLTGSAIILVGYRACEVRKYVDEYAAYHYPNATVRYAQQPVQKGLCDGLLCCETLLDGDDFLLFLGDEIVTEPAHRTMIKAFEDSGALAVCGYVRAKRKEDVKKTYSLELSENRVVCLVEKPLHPTNNMVGTGNCIFKNSFLGNIHDYHKKTCFSFPDVLQTAINDAETVIACEIGKAYLNFNYAEDIATFIRKKV